MRTPTARILGTAVGLAVAASGLGFATLAQAATVQVAGNTLNETQTKNLTQLVRGAYPHLQGSADERATVLSTAAWWSLKEGVLDTSFTYSNCHFTDGDRHIGPFESCPGDVWQVGLGAVQVNNFTSAEVDALATKLHGSPDTALAAVLKQAGATEAQAATVRKDERLRRSWLLRDSAIGATLVSRNVKSECIDDALSWCYGSGWDTSALYAKDRTTGDRARADLKKAVTQISRSSVLKPGAAETDRPTKGQPSKGAKPSKGAATTTARAGQGVEAKVWKLGGTPLNVRQSASTDSPVVRTIDEGQTITIACQKRGPVVHNDVAGVSSDLWDHVPALGGWVADAWIWTGTDDQVAPDCGDAATDPGEPGDETTTKPSGKNLKVAEIIEGADTESQAFGPTDWAAQNCDMYSYGTSHGLPACQHPGVDRAAARGTGVVSPVSGTVVTAGGTPYFLDSEDKAGVAGTGELKIKLDNGDELILGHLATISVQVGQKVTPGAAVGTVGYTAGAHVHVEYRVPDASTPAGTRVVDPYGKLG